MESVKNEKRREERFLRVSCGTKQIKRMKCSDADREDGKKGREGMSYQETGCRLYKYICDFCCICLLFKVEY